MNLKEAREACGYSQKFVALSIGVSAPAVSDWEKGKKKPTLANLEKLASLYGTTTDYLLGVSDDSEQQKKPIEADVPDALLNSPIKLEALAAFSSLSPEDQQFFVDMMRARGKT